MMIARFCFVAVLLVAGLAQAAPGVTDAPAAVPVAAERAAPIPFKRDAVPVASTLTSAGVAIVVLSLAAIGTVLFLRKRLGLSALPGSPARLVRVLETQRLGPRALLSVVEFGGSQHLIAQGEHGISCLVSAPLADTPKEPS